MSTQQTERFTGWAMPEPKAPTYRVTFGWSAYHNFSSLHAARAFAVHMAAMPTGDDLVRRVAILDMTVAGYPTVCEYERPST